MTQPTDQSGSGPSSRQFPLSEAVEQAADAAEQLLRGLQQFAEAEADALASRTYGVADLATAPLRLFGILVSNAVNTTQVLSDNLTVLSLTGSFGAVTARRALRIDVGVRSLPAGASLVASDLVGRLTKHRIRAKKITIDTTDLANEGVVTLSVLVGLVRPDTYVGTLVSTDPQRVVNEQFLLAINELGVTVT